MKHIDVIFGVHELAQLVTGFIDASCGVSCGLACSSHYFHDTFWQVTTSLVLSGEKDTRFSELPRLGTTSSSLQVLWIRNFKDVFFNQFELNWVRLCKIRFDNCTFAIPDPISSNKLVKFETSSSGCDSWMKSRLQQITQLQFICCEFTNLPMDPATLVNLHKLEISSNRSIQTLLGIKALKKLRELTVVNCFALQEIPIEVGHLQHLETLDVSGNICLSQVPASIGDLKKLQQLNLTRCTRITTIPESITQLPSLYYLQLYRCAELRNLPNGIGAMKSLRKVGLLNCPKLHVPDSLGQEKIVHSSMLNRW